MRPEEEGLTYDSSHQTEDYGDGHKGPVPVMFAPDSGHAQEDEDQGLADAAPHLQEVLDGGVRFVGYVGFYVRPHHSPACNQPTGRRGEQRGIGSHESVISFDSNFFFFFCLGRACVRYCSGEHKVFLF